MLKRLAVLLVVTGIVAMPAVVWAQAPAQGEQPAASAENGFRLLDAAGAAYFAGAFGAALVIIGGAKGISHIGASAVESMARQPEAAGSISTAMIITAAMIEGATLFAVVVCMLAVGK